MNTTLQTIQNRRSTRKFKPDQIKDEELEILLTAGKSAPTAHNQQPWHFTVVQNKEMLGKITEAVKDVFSKSGNSQYETIAKSENFAPFYNAPTLFIVTSDEKAIAPIHDGTLALGYMLLAAEAIDIGACWIHGINYVFNTEAGKKLKEELGIPEGYGPVGSCAIGYKAQPSSSPIPKKDNVVNIIK